MSMLDRKLVRDVWRLKGQVITIALVVASGVSAFVASLTTYESMLSMQATYYDSARFAHVFSTARRAPNSVAPRLLEVPGVAEVETTIAYDVLLDMPGVLEPLAARIIALPEHGLPRMNRLTLMSGRWIDAPESNQILVSEPFAQAHGLVPGDHVSALLNGKLEKLQIVGLALSPEYIFSIGTGLGDEKSFGVFWIGRKRLAAAFNMEGAFNRAALRLARQASEPAVIAAVDRVLEAYGSSGAHGRDEQMSHRMLTQEINEQRVFGIVLPSVFLAVAVFLLNVVLSRQIGTQRGQIAALKALGCPDWRIGLHYLQFVLVIVVVGIVIGVLAGAWLGRGLSDLYSHYFRFPSFDYRMQPWIPLTASAAALLAACVGGLQAVLRVVRLPPAEAMRPATPLAFRPTLAERIGLGHLYSPAVRMIIRDMERRPARAVFTTIGIAAALAILISGTWWRDAIEYLLNVELRMRERQHVSVVLAEPVTSAAVYDLANLPGVLRAEADRTAEVRLRNGHRTWRTTITGLPPDSQMRLLLDARLRTVPLPAEGLVMTDRLAARLGVRVGQRVRIEFLHGARVQREVPLAGLTADMMEMQVYMARDALNRLLGEGDSISGARLLLDGAEREDFLRAVKRTPRLSFVIEIEPIIRNFRETSARNILVFTGVLTVLAGTIAVGVVYNNARIALAERAWELASLRVLGFTRREVSTLLLGELSLEMLAALPIGWLLGYWLSWFIVRLIEPETFQIPFVIEPSTYAYSTLIVLVAGVISALIVRRKVDQLDLVAVLKTRE
jgi:putative ABC transport system permease protein